MVSAATNPRSQSVLIWFFCDRCEHDVARNADEGHQVSRPSPTSGAVPDRWLVAKPTSSLLSFGSSCVGNELRFPTGTAF